MKRTLTVIILLACSQAFADSDDWFDIGKRGYDLYFSAGYYEAGASLTGISARAPLPFAAEISGRYTRIRGDDNDQNSSGLFIQSDPLATFSFGLGYETSELGDGRELDDWQLLAGWNIHRWYLEGQYITGQTRERPQELSEELVNNLNESDLLTADRRGFGATLAYHGNGWGSQIIVSRYDLDQPSMDAAAMVSLLQTASEEERRALLNGAFASGERVRYGSSRRSTSRSSAQPYQQVNPIAETEIGADIFFNRDRYRFAFGTYWYDDLYINEQVSSFFGRIDYNLNDTVALGMLIGASDEPESMYTEFGVGFSW